MIKKIKWSLISAPSIVLSLLFLILIKIDVGDIMFSMLSGSVIGSAGMILWLAKGYSGDSALKLLFFSVAGSFVSWMFFLVLLKITTISLYSNTALAFDIVVGVIGSSTVIAVFFDKQFEKISD